MGLAGELLTQLFLYILVPAFFPYHCRARALGVLKVICSTDTQTSSYVFLWCAGLLYFRCISELLIAQLLPLA